MATVLCCVICTSRDLKLQQLWSQVQSADPLPSFEEDRLLPQKTHQATGQQTLGSPRRTKQQKMLTTESRQQQNASFQDLSTRPALETFASARKGCPNVIANHSTPRHYTDPKLHEWLTETSPNRQLWANISKTQLFC